MAKEAPRRLTPAKRVSVKISGEFVDRLRAKSERLGGYPHAIRSVLEEWANLQDNPPA